MTYKNFQADSAPPALQHERWRAFTGALGDAKDAVALAARDALRSMLVGECPEDALAHIAAERRLERFPTETTEQHRARLAAAWASFEFLGTKAGLVGALTAAGHSPVVYEANAAAPPWWVGAWPPASEGPMPSAWVGTWPVPAGDVAGWPSRFWVDLKLTAWSPWTWGSGPFWGDEDRTWGSTATRAEVALVKRIIRRWRPAHCVCIGVFVELTDSSRILWPTWPNEV
jgi:hypothetical protein